MAKAASNGLALDVRELSVSYGGVKAVDEVSFSVPTGSIVGLIGPNGAGKTTIFDAICGYAILERGHVFLGSTEITSMDPSARARSGLGRSFQDARLFSSLTVSETLSCAFERHIKRQGPVATALGMPWIIRGERRIATRVDELVELMGLRAFRDKFISELSTGTRRVVDLASTLAHEPTVLLLDEPSSGMAQRETEAMGPLLLRVKEATGCTMLLIEHDMPLITSVSDELIALETGTVIARGGPREVTNDRRVVEAYLGTDERIIARSGDQNAPARSVPQKRSTTTKKKKVSSTKRTSSTKRATAKSKTSTKKTTTTSSATRTRTTGKKKPNPSRTRRSR